MKNHATGIVSFLLITAIAFLVYPATYYNAGQNAGTTVQNVIVDNEADEAVSFSDYMFL